MSNRPATPFCVGAWHDAISMARRRLFRRLTSPCLAALLVSACGDDKATNTPTEPALLDWPCQSDPSAAAPDYLQKIGCETDYLGLASVPLDATTPGAHSLKVVLDQSGGDALYFQNSTKYQVHWNFASAYLSGANGLPVVEQLSKFNEVEYYSLGRRFVLGAVAYYDGPKVWALELAPYDTATPAMIEKLYDGLKSATYFGPRLVFHPTSVALETVAKDLPSDVGVLSSKELWAGIDYQPLALGTVMGTLRFFTAAQLATSRVGFRDVVVLDRVTNDLSPVTGVISEEFQTPLSHMNLLLQERGVANMGLRKATSNATLRALDGKPVRLDVGALSWSVQEVSTAEADAWWESIKPATLQTLPYDLTVTELKDAAAVVVETDTIPLRKAIETSAAAFGGRVSHYSGLATTLGITVPKAFGVPVYYYDQFMRQNGFADRVNALLADPSFTADAAVRDQQLSQLRTDMLAAPVDQAFQDLLSAKLAASLPGVTLARFRSSSNAEDLNASGAAGLYDSENGNPSDWPTVLDAVRKVWASLWRFRAFEERSWRGIDQRSLGMGLLVHHAFQAEPANGAALTANPFDAHGVEPAFYVNAQWGESSVTLPASGMTADQLLYFFDYPNQPAVFFQHSSLVAEGEAVLSRLHTFRLGEGLAAIHQRFNPAYQSAGYYAMSVEFKLYAETGGDPAIVFEHARPYRGRGSDPLAP